jgi:hypothetical protein
VTGAMKRMHVQSTAIGAYLMLLFAKNQLAIWFSDRIQATSRFENTRLLVAPGFYAIDSVASIL